MTVSINKTIPKNNILAGEEGVAIVTVLLLLMLLSFIAITSTQTSITEKSIIRSDAIFEQGFYLAESAAMEGIQRLDNETEPDELLAPLIETGVSENDGLLIAAIEDDDPMNDMLNLDSNTDGMITGDDTFDVSELNADTYRLVVQQPIEAGHSLALGSSRLYGYLSYGLTEANGGKAMVKVGFKKRF